MSNPSRFDQHVNLTRLNSCEGQLRIANLSIEEPYAVMSARTGLWELRVGNDLEPPGPPHRNSSPTLQQSTPRKASQH
jgi:hypothetical protein